MDLETEYLKFSAVIKKYILLLVKIKLKLTMTKHYSGQEIKQLP